MVCDVSTCVAAASSGSKFCAQHEHARTAKELRLGPDSEGRGAVRCGKCRRAFKDDDYVDRQSHMVKTRKGPVSKWIHVACNPTSPRTSKKAIRESDKPLLAGA